jgi:hypothetical protein
VAVSTPGSNVTVSMEKCSVPLLWLDTFFFIKLAKLEAGEPVPEPDRSRLNLLIDAIATARARGRVICVEGQQFEEVQVGFGDIERVGGCITRTTWAVRLKHRDRIKRIQFRCLASAYLKDESDITIPSRSAFYTDPVEEAESHKSFVITCHNDLSPEARLKLRETKLLVRELWNDIREENLAHGITFEQQREFEHEYLPDVAAEEFRRAIAKTQTGDQTAGLDLAQTQTWGFMRSWSHAGGRPGGFWPFIKSAHFRAIPTVDLSANLLADILTGKRPVDDGDSMDVHHIASALPYCDFALLDKRMCNRVRRRGMDKKYGVKVFAMKHIDQLVAELETPR